MAFLVTLQSRNYQYSTIQGYLAAISFGHKVRGFQDPTSSFLLRKFMTGVKRRAPKGRPLQPVTLTMLSELIQLVSSLGVSHFTGALLKAVFSLLYHGCLRISEVAVSGRADHVLRQHQVKFQYSFPTGHPRSITLHFTSFKHSKTSAKVQILASHNSCICPVQLLSHFLSIKPPSPYLFCGADGLPITRGFIVQWLNRLVARSSFSHLRINTHSLRIGRTTDLALTGASDAYIRQAGRWASDAYLKYIRPVVVL